MSKLGNEFEADAVRSEFREIIKIGWELHTLRGAEKKLQHIGLRDREKRRRHQRYSRQTEPTRKLAKSDDFIKSDTRDIGDYLQRTGVLGNGCEYFLPLRQVHPNKLTSTPKREHPMHAAPPQKGKVRGKGAFH
jgi:hypothetical protein